MRKKLGNLSNLTRLRMLCELRRLGTMGEVAEVLMMTHSAVSQQLAQLEKEVGYRLVEKAGRGVRLNDRGELLADYAAKMLALADEAQAALKDRRDVAGLLKVATFQSALVGLIPTLVKILDRDYPELSVEFVQFDVADGIAELLSHRVDVVIGEELPFAPTTDSPSLHREDLYAEPMVLAYPKGSTWFAAEDFAELESVPFLLNPAGTVAGYWERNFCLAQGFVPTVLVESPDPLLQLNLVSQGVGVALIPSLVLRSERGPLPGVDVYHLPGDPERVLFTAVRIGRENHPAIKALRRALHVARP